jgi:hypothetical protein
MNKLTADLLNKLPSVVRPMRNTNIRTILRKLFCYSLLNAIFPKYEPTRAISNSPEEMNVRNRLPRLQQIRPPSEVAGLKLPITMKDRA